MTTDCEPLIVERVLTAATLVHQALGRGLLESVYQRARLLELQVAGIPARSEIEVPVRYRGVDLGCGFRVDLLVAERLVLEVKSVSGGWS
jgi:GxxExxY protein